MGPKDVIRNTLDMSDYMTRSYLKDLSDADLLVRPVEGMHPIALQLGHLISVERMIMELISPGSSPPLPEGFAEAHDLKKEGSDDSRFSTLEEYNKLWDAQRAATKSLLDSIDEAELDSNKGGTLPQWLANIGAGFNVAGLHALNHSGQFVAVRRKLNKPIAF